MTLTFYGLILIKLSYFDHYIAENAPNIFFVSKCLPCALLYQEIIYFILLELYFSTIIPHIGCS